MKLKLKLKNQIKQDGFVVGIIYILGSAIHKLLIPVLKKYIFITQKLDNKKILFLSEPDFSDNAKVLYDYLKNKTNTYKFVWLLKNDNCYNENVKFIKCKSKFHCGYKIRALFEIYTSKYIFFTHSSPVYEFGKRDGQIIINLWHGCGYKDTNSNVAWIEQNPFDYVLVPGNVFIKTKTRFFSCNQNQVIPIGYPRYDLLLSDSRKAFCYVDALKGDNDKFIVWMPTYRKTKSGKYGVEKIVGYYELPILDSKEELIKLNEECKKNRIMICIKRHPLQLKYECESMSLSNICFISNDSLVKNNIELYSFFKYTDGLITDYSSIAIDYLLLDKPIAFTLNDFDAYNTNQGFVFENPLKYMPGNHIFSFSDLICYLEDIKHQNDKYKSNRLQIFDEVHNPCRDYCKRVIDYFNL